MSIKIGRIVMGVCQTNCYFLHEEGKKEVIFVDPADRGDLLYEKLNEAGYVVEGILLTHAHFDHIWGVEQLVEKSGAKVYAYEGEKDLCESVELNVSKRVSRPCTVKVDKYLKDGEEIEIAGLKAKVISTPGHTKGSCCYFFEEDKVLISGDTLFLESVGRTDLPTGSGAEISRSLTEKLLKLEDDVVVYPGHGDETTIGHERKYNPFV